jgi:hypothetical protein
MPMYTLPTTTTTYVCLFRLSFVFCDLEGHFVAWTWQWTIIFE